MRLFSIIDRHIGRSVLFSTLLVFTIVFLLMTFVVFVDGLRTVGKADYGWLEHIQYVFLSQPKRIYELFPTIALLGAIVGLSYLAASSELVAMRAAGVSVWRIVLAVLKVGLVFVVAGVLMGEFVVPAAEEEAQRVRAQALHTGFTDEVIGVWLRDGDEFINVGEVLPDRSLLHVTIYKFDNEARLISQRYARRARYQDSFWRLEQVRQSRILPARVTVSRRDSAEWYSALTPDEMAAFAVKPEGMSMRNLRRYIAHLQDNRQETARYELAFWGKVFSPLATAVMLLLAIPFVFGHSRSGGMGYRVFIGIVVGFAFNLLNLSFGYVALLANVPPVAGALMPSLIFFSIAAFMLRRAG